MTETAEPQVEQKPPKIFGFLAKAKIWVIGLVIGALLGAGGVHSSSMECQSYVKSATSGKSANGNSTQPKSEFPPFAFSGASTLEFRSLICPFEIYALRAILGLERIVNHERENEGENLQPPVFGKKREELLKEGETRL